VKAQKATLAPKTTAPKAAAPAPAAAQSAPAARQPAPAKAKTTSTPAPAPTATADDEIEEIEPPADLTVDDFIIPLGQRKGQKLAEQQLNVIEWYATQMTTGGDSQKEALKKAAQDIITVRSNGHKPRSTAA
jgi:hypothetical protein